MTPFVRRILQAARIAELKAAVGVPPPSLDELTPEQRRLVEWFEAALRAEYDAALDRLKADAAKLRAEMQATRATLSTAPPRPARSGDAAELTSLNGVALANIRLPCRRRLFTKQTFSSREFRPLQKCYYPELTTDRWHASEVS